MTDTHSGNEPRRYALVIGIDDYPFVHANPLHGCRNDAEHMAGILSRGFGFRVRLLLDHEATRSAILEALDDLAHRARPNDRIVLHFSGHGSRIRSPDGGTIETLVPRDSGRGEYPNRDVTDRELYSWLLRLSSVTPYTTLIFDSCHAGGIVRDLEATARGIEEDSRPEAAEDKDAFVPSAALGPTRDAALPGASGWMPASDRYTLIAACKAEERAREVRDAATGRAHGALTFLLAEELTRLTEPASYRQVFDTVALRLTSRFREQHPQLEGAWDRELFGTRHLTPPRFIPVLSRRGQQIELGAGAAHGLVSGSRWQVHPPGGCVGSLQGEALGRIQVDDVGAVTAIARLLNETAPGAVDAGGRAVEVERPAGSDRLGVRLRGDEPEIARRIDESTLLKLAQDGDPWDFAVHRLTPRHAVNGTEPVPQLGPIGRPIWAVTDASGRLVMLPKLVAAPEAADRILANLETWARHRALTELRHPDPEHPLRDALEIELRRRRPGGEWKPAEPAADGRLVYEEGDLLGIRLRSSYEGALFIAVLDLGLSGAARLLYPVRGACRDLPAWHDLKIGLEAAEQLELFVPEELPYPGETFEAAQETLVFLATTEAADLGVLAQEGVREILAGTLEDDVSTPPLPATDSQLATLLRLAVEGSAGRDSRKALRRDAPGLWTVTTRTFWLYR